MEQTGIHYKYGNKNNWRRTVWNDIVARLSVPPREAVVLYLAGAQDLDRQVAMSKGFESQNLIACDRDPSVVGDLRARGTITIRGDICDIAANLGHRRRIDVLVADFTSDLSLKIARQFINRVLPRPALLDAVFVMNFCRGRDATMGEFRTKVTAAVHAGKFERHRGMIFWDALTSSLSFRASWEHEYADLESDPAALRAFVAEINRARVRYEAIANPVLRSYRSASHQTFDSIVFRSPFRIASAVERDQLATIVDRIYSPDERARRQIAAALAHRTMRRQARAHSRGAGV